MQEYKDPLSVPLTKGSLSHILKCQARWWRRNVTAVVLFWEVAKEPFVPHGAKSDSSLFPGKRAVTIEQAGLPFHRRQFISWCMHNANEGTETLTGVVIPECKNYSKSSSYNAPVHYNKLIFQHSPFCSLANLILCSQINCPTSYVHCATVCFIFTCFYSAYHLWEVKVSSVFSVWY